MPDRLIIHVDVRGSEVAVIRADQVFSGLAIGEESVPTTKVLFDLVEARGARGAIIDGIARDNQGGGIPGVDFELRDIRGNLVRSEASDDEGRFRWSELPAGTYDLMGTQQGFDPVEMRVQVEAGRTYLLQASMNFQEKAFEFQVDRTWKWPLPETVRVRTSLSTAGFPFEIGHRYLVLATEDSDGSLATGLCSGTRPLEDADRYLDLLDELASGSFPDVIQGWVMARTSDETGPLDFLLENTRITVVGMGLRLQTDPGPDGYFRTPQLPVGKYRIYTEAPVGTFLANPQEWATIGGDVSCPELRFDLQSVTRTK